MELPTISRGSMESPGRVEARHPAAQGLWKRRSKLEKGLLGVCCVALVACAALVGVVATSSSGPSLLTLEAPPAEEPMPQ